MRRNVASQVVGAQMITAADGSAFTGSVTVAVTGDGGTQATGSVGSGACTHEGNGFHTYAPAQAETNYDHVAFTFTGTGAIPVTVQVYTSFPQTGDSFARIGATGSGLTSLASQASVDTIDDFLDTEIAAILADTNELQTDWANGGRLDLILDARASQTSVDAIDDFLDTEVAAILADTNELQTDWANGGRLDLILDARASQTSVDTIDDFLDTEVAAILADTNELQADLTDGGRLDLILDAILLDTGTTLQAELDGIQADTEDIQARLPAALVSGRMSSDMVAVSGDTTAADRLEALMDGIIVAQVNDAGATTTAFIADGFTEATDDHFIGRLITFISGALSGQQTDITDYTGATQTFTVSALTEAPGNNDFFVIH